MPWEPDHRHGTRPHVGDGGDQLHIQCGQPASDGDDAALYGHAGKWKTFTSDAMGNLVTVTEPNPVSGTDVTTCAYNAVNQLRTATMPRSSGTQTRTFGWTGSDMTSATNPENGTVTYTYNAAHCVLSRADAKIQKTQYTYNQYGYRTMVQHFDVSQVEQLSPQGSRPTQIGTP